MRAFSVWNPWAWALCVGIKPYENRDWSLPRAFTGQRVLIHCGAHKPTRDEIGMVEDAAVDAGVPMPEWAKAPVGGIVGSLIFDGDVSPEDADSIWAIGDRCWHVKPGSALLFKAAIPCKGALGFFRPPPAVLERFGAKATP